MDLRWEWLAPLVTVPYVPALGPVHPSALTAQRFADVLAVAGTGGFVPYDKDRRWAAAKSETVLAEDISCQPGLTLIPTLRGHRAGTVRVHVYAAGPGARARAAEQAAVLRARHGAAAAQVVSFHDPEHPPPGPATRVQLKDFAGPCPEPELPVGLLTGLPAAQRATFAGFAAAMAGDGFAFLHQRLQSGRAGPVMVTVTGGHVSGAIGPLETRPDAAGNAQLMPQYFGVLPQMRGQGLGRALWRAAMRWGREHGAAYQLLQTTADGPSDRLCQAEGLTSLGYVSRVPA